MKANLLRLQNEWETVQASRDRDAIYQYLTAVFELVTWWAQEGRAVDRAYRALRLRGYSRSESQNRSRPSFVARLIRQKLMIGRGANGPVCCGTRRNTRTWMSRCGDFIKRKGGINKCASRFARRLGHRSPSVNRESAKN